MEMTINLLTVGFDANIIEAIDADEREFFVLNTFNISTLGVTIEPLDSYLEYAEEGVLDDFDLVTHAMYGSGIAGYNHSIGPFPTPDAFWNPYGLESVEDVIQLVKYESALSNGYDYSLVDEFCELTTPEQYEWDFMLSCKRLLFKYNRDEISDYDKENAEQILREAPNRVVIRYYELLESICNDI